EGSRLSAFGPQLRGQDEREPNATERERRLATLEPRAKSAKSRFMTQPFVLARTSAGADVVFRPALANRHGLIAGATGTGKTVTLQVMAEQLSRLGVPVFLADVKSDLSGIAAAGSATPKMRDRLNAIGIPQPPWSAAPVA